MPNGEGGTWTFERVTVREEGDGWVIVGEAPDETETLFASSLSVHGWELSVDGALTLRNGVDDTVTVEVQGDHVDLHD